MKRTYNKEWLEQYIYDNGITIEEAATQLPNLSVKEAYNLIYGKPITQIKGHITDNEYLTESEYIEYSPLDDDLRAEFENRYIDYTDNYYFKYCSDKWLMDNRSLTYEDHTHDIFLKLMLKETTPTKKLISKCIHDNNVDYYRKNKKERITDIPPDTYYCSNDGEYNLLLQELIKKYQE
ncbi:hypothetical protein [Carboxylicivirga sp. RSCT41]|uniref:hypothetical protein n=1 Tax=Carboxylicivirga agarovorans TaxID=3417570 RepID=UPI003D3370FD